MKLLYSLMQFMMSEWLWSFTFAFYHPLINVLLMILLLTLVARQRIIAAVLYAVTSQLFAWIFFTAMVHLLFDMAFGVSFDDYEGKAMIHPLAACFLLGIIYASLQTIFFYSISFFYQFSVKQYSRIVFLSNAIAALIVFKFLPVL